MKFIKLIFRLRLRVKIRVITLKFIIAIIARFSTFALPDLLTLELNVPRGFKLDIQFILFIPRNILPLRLKQSALIRKMEAFSKEGPDTLDIAVEVVLGVLVVDGDHLGEIDNDRGYTWLIWIGALGAG